MQKYFYVLLPLLFLGFYQNCSGGFQADFSELSSTEEEFENVFETENSSPTTDTQAPTQNIIDTTADLPGDGSYPFTFMTKNEISNIIIDLFSVKKISTELQTAINNIPTLGVSLATDGTLYNSNNSGLLTSSNYHSKLFTLSEVLADFIVEETKIDTNCMNSQDCYAEIVMPLMQRLWRRPLTSSETDEIKKVLQQDLSIENLKITIIAIINSPQFYLKNNYTSNTVNSVHDMVHKFSFFMIDSIPDQQLYTELIDGDIKTVDDLLPHVDRLLSKDDFSERFVRNTLLPWLRLKEHENDVSSISNVIFNRKAVIKTLLDKEVIRLKTIIRNNKNIKEIFYANGNKSLVLNPLFAFKTSTDRTDEKTHVVNRGFYITEHFMCRANPPNQLSAEAITSVLGPGHVDLAEIEVSNIRRNHGACAGCHSESDKHGIALEQLGPFGGLRTKYEDRSTIDYNLDFNGVTVTEFNQYAQVLSENAELHQCFNKIISSKLNQLNVFKKQSSVAQFNSSDLNISLKDYIKKIIISPIFK